MRTGFYWVTLLPQGIISQQNDMCAMIPCFSVRAVILPQLSVHEVLMGPTPCWTPHWIGLTYQSGEQLVCL